MAKWDTKETKDLIDVIVSLRSHTEAKNFLRDLMTESELIEFGKRWQVAQMLHHKIPYTEIIASTGLSSTTVARISKWLSRSKGYKAMIKRHKL